jgi:hypothetical protein
MYKNHLSSDLNHTFKQTLSNSDFNEFKEFYHAGVTLSDDEKYHLRKQKKINRAEKLLTHFQQSSYDLSAMKYEKRLDKLAQVAKQLQKNKEVRFYSENKHLLTQVKDRSFYLRKYLEITRRFSLRVLGGLNLKSSIDRETKKKLLNSFYCCSQLASTPAKDKAVYIYCKNRLCVTCQKIRAGQIINKIENSGIDFTGWVMVTLTIKSELLKNLPSTIRKMRDVLKKWRKVQDKRKVKADAFRSMEITYNVLTGEPHPHYHIICSPEYAQGLTDYWLEHFPDSKDYLQDVRLFNGNWQEITKYITKLQADYPANFYSMLYFAMTGFRQYQASGCLYGLKIDDEVEQEKIIPELLDRFRYDSDLQDWINEQTGELFIAKTDIEIDQIRDSKELQEYLERYIDKDLSG